MLRLPADTQAAQPQIILSIKYVPLLTPTEYEDIIFTHGYSIENDLYASGKRAIDNVLKPNELAQKEEVLDSLAEWFAFEIKKTTPFFDFTLLQTKVMAQNNTQFTADFLRDCGFILPSQNEIDEIKANDYRKLRGKFILQVYIKLFQYRQAIQGAKFSEAHIFEICVGEAMSNEQPQPINRIVNILKQIFV
jgi:hypothetical protein